MTEPITSLLLDDSPKVRELAHLIVDLEKALQDRSISKEEYTSLMLDIERLREVITVSNNARVDIILHHAIVLLVDLAKVVW